MTGRHRWAAALTGMLAVSATLGPGREAAAGHHRPVQPGALFRNDDGRWCSFNFVFTDRVDLYIGAAAHCTKGPGWRVQVPEAGEVGTVVYRQYNKQDATRPFRDFALIKVDEDQRHLVDPSVRRWGGPTEVEQVFVPRSVIFHYGNGAVLSAPEAARGRLGELVEVYGPEHGVAASGWYLANVAVIGGDSGSPVLTVDGKALGTLVWVAMGDPRPAVAMGPTIATVVSQLRQAGFHLDLVTAPFHNAGPERLAAEGAQVVLDCASEPYAASPYADACLRQPLPPGYPPVPPKPTGLAGRSSSSGSMPTSSAHISCSADASRKARRAFSRVSASITQLSVPSGRRNCALHFIAIPRSRPHPAHSPGGQVGLH